MSSATVQPDLFTLLNPYPILKPYLVPLIDSPSALLSTITSNPISFPFLLCSLSTLFTFVLGEITGNLSQVDRLWPFLPTIYGAWWTFYAWNYVSDDIEGVEAQRWRTLIFTFCQLMWTTRITIHSIRRGFYSKGGETEDYRWPIIRSYIPEPWMLSIFNFVIVAVYQNLLLLVAVLPQFFLIASISPPSNSSTHLPPPNPLNTLDMVIPSFMLLNLSLEHTADSQQQAYQRWKHSEAANQGFGGVGSTAGGATPREMKLLGGRRARGFCTEGMWGWSRHPNFLFEQLNFYILYLFSVASSFPTLSPTFRGPPPPLTDLVNPSLFGPLMMSLLFLGSTPLTEYISAQKYPLYREYQKRVAMFWFHETPLRGLMLGKKQRESIDELVYGSGLPPKLD